MRENLDIEASPPFSIAIENCLDFYKVDDYVNSSNVKL